MKRTIMITLTEDDLYDAALTLGDAETYEDALLKTGERYSQGVVEFITVLLGRDLRDRQTTLDNLLARG